MRRWTQVKRVPLIMLIAAGLLFFGAPASADHSGRDSQVREKEWYVGEILDMETELQIKMRDYEEARRYSDTERAEALREEIAELETKLDAVAPRRYRDYGPGWQEGKRYYRVLPYGGYRYYKSHPYGRYPYYRGYPYKGHGYYQGYGPGFTFRYGHRGYGFGYRGYGHRGNGHSGGRRH
jgi:hypothetical protein